MCLRASEETLDAEELVEEANDLAQAEDATLNEAEIRKQNKALKQISKLKSWFNPDPSKFLETQNSGREMIVKTADFAFNLVDLVKDPMRHTIILKRTRKLCGAAQFRRNLKKWKPKEFGRNFRSRRSPTDGTVSKISGFLKPNVTEYFERG